MIRPMRHRVPAAGNYRLRGFGALPAIVTGGTQLVATPGYATCDPRDTACVNANQALSDQYNLDVEQAQAQNNYDQCAANARNASTPAQYAAVMAACGGQAAQQSGGQSIITTSGGGPVSAAPLGQFSFTSSRGGSNLQVGDTWKIAISGAAPNSPVTSFGNMPSGFYSATSMGATDGSGNFAKSGVLDASTVGQWQENWAVNGVPVGQIGFNVSAASAPAAATAAPTTPAGAVVINSSGAQQPSGGSTPPPATGFDWSSPWVLGAAAAIALVAFGGSGGR